MSSVVLLSWGLLLAAFSPTLVDLVRHWLQQPWSAYSSVFLLLFAREAVRASGSERVRWLGVALAVSGIFAQAALVAADRLSWSRIAMAICMAGLGLALGRPAGARAALAVFAVPPPVMLQEWFLRSLMAILLAIDVDLGISAGAGVPEAVEARNHGLHLFPQDTGLPLSAFLAGLSWYLALLDRAAWRAQLVALTRGAAMGAGIQACAILVSLGVSATWSASFGQDLLALAPWIVGIAWISAAAVRRARTDPS